MLQEALALAILRGTKSFIKFASQPPNIKDSGHIKSFIEPHIDAHFCECVRLFDVLKRQLDSRGNAFC